MLCTDYRLVRAQLQRSLRVCRRREGKNRVTTYYYHHHAYIGICNAHAELIMYTAAGKQTHRLLLSVWRGLIIIFECIEEEKNERTTDAVPGIRDICTRIFIIYVVQTNARTNIINDALMHTRRAGNFVMKSIRAEDEKNERIKKKLLY